MDRIQELLTRLADLSDAEIAELEGLILAEFDSVEAEEPTNDSVERMVSLADALDSVRSEVGRRNDHAEELAQKAAEASSRVHADASAEAPAESEMAIPDPDEEEEPPAEEALPSEDEITEDIAQVTDDVEQAVEDAEAAGEEKAAEEDDEEKDKLSEDAPAEAELSEANNTEIPTELSSDSEAATTPTETSEQENAMTASIDQGDGVVVTPPADAAPVPSLTASGVGLTITAGADIPSYGSGAELSNMDQVADAFAKRLHTLRNVQGASGSQFTIATLSYDYPEDRKLQGDDAGNITKVNKVTSPQAITAAAGICAPLETIYDINVCGDADRPIRDALARFNADRGGIKIFGAPTLAVPDGTGKAGDSSGIWDPASPKAKSCAEAQCPVPQEIGLEAIYACMKFSNYTNRFFPEVIKANTDLAMINHARMADLHLLGKIFAQSAQYETDALAGTKGGKPTVGLVRSFVVVLANAASYLRRVHRLAADAPMRAILPSWVLDAMVADLAMQMPGDGLEVLSLSEARINGLFRERGVNVTWSLDSWTYDKGEADSNPALPKAATVASPSIGSGGVVTQPTPANGPIKGGGWETDLGFPLFPEGTFLFLDGGTLDLGVQRDMTMVSANEYATFVETFEGVAKTGCDSLWVTMKVCVSGAAAALVDTAC